MMKNNEKVLNSVVIGLLLFMASSLVHSKAYLASTLVDNLSYPWSIAFLPNKDMLVTEKTGSLRLIRNGKLLEKKISGLPEIYTQGQGGLLEIILDPNFETNQNIYLSYSSGTRNKNTLQVISAKLDQLSLKDVSVILTVSPTRDTPHHYGGRMAFLPDGTLLVTSGEGFNFREQAQQLDSLLGKILRINTDGSIPKNNPFVGHKNTKAEIYSYGHRNPQALLVGKDGVVWQHEHGPKGGDELNVISAGLNYGWPAITYGIDYSGAVISPYTEAERMQQPITYWVPSIAPSGMTEYQGDVFPQWKGNLFVSALAERSVRRLSMKEGKVIAQEVMLTELDSRIRDIRTGPDGYIYVLTDSSQGAVIKLSPVQ
jgi:glucose/arabinose dehydrogenase